MPRMACKDFGCMSFSAFLKTTDFEKHIWEQFGLDLKSSGLDFGRPWNSLLGAILGHVGACLFFLFFPGIDDENH